MKKSFGSNTMNNLICVFFGHKDDKLLFENEKDRMTIINNDIDIARFTMCKRCNTVYLRTLDTKL